jgi:hypothetical protein
MAKIIKHSHLLRYGTAGDQKYLLGDFLSTYDQLIINANMVAHMPGAMATFITQRAKDKPYFIDPQTHAFQHDISHIESKSEKKQGEIKRSFERLIQAYGEPLATCVGREHNSILPDDFSYPKKRLAFCKRVLDFQLNSLKNEIEKTDSAKYYKYLKKQGIGAAGACSPILVVAPYFYMTSNTLNSWLPINKSCAQDSYHYTSKSEILLGVQIVISQDVLTSNSKRKQLVASYKNAITPDVFLVWIDDFNEHEASEDDLKSFVKLISSLGKIAPVVNLYGSFFSVALMKSKVIDNFIGVAHSIEYGESRAVSPVGGGIPVSKYYLPNLHFRMLFRNALRAIRALKGMLNAKDFQKRICNCKECKSVITNSPEDQFKEFGRTRSTASWRRGQPIVLEFPLSEARDHCRRHYMWCKQKEYEQVASLDAIIAQLRDTREKLKRPLGLDGVAHCRTWENALLSAKRQRGN